MEKLLTPGVYIEEINAFPNSVVGIPTAVPAFIGYTQKAEAGGKSLTLKPTRVNSLAEFVSYFGGGPALKFNLKDVTPPATLPASYVAQRVDFTLGTAKYNLERDASATYNLYSALRFFYANGGGPCYIVSVGNYSDGTIKMDDLVAGLTTLEKSQEPTMVLAPDALLLKDPAPTKDKDGKDVPAIPGANCYSFYTKMLEHCGYTMKNRVALLDIVNGDTQPSPTSNPVANFRDSIGTSFLDYSAAYYPWLRTNVVQINELDFRMVLGDPLAADAAWATLLPGVSDSSPLGALLKANKRPTMLVYLLIMETATSSMSDDKKLAFVKKLLDLPTLASNKDVAQHDIDIYNQMLLSVSPLYNSIMAMVLERLNLMAPTSAMAGIYTMVDNTRGVWKAPANVSINSVLAPSVNISDAEQEDLNVTLTGKSINAIRYFTGQGILVWGARTLAGNSQDWRYINVRRTLLYLEQSIKAAARAYVFEPNDAKTWVSMKGMINNFLHDVWKQGGLVGAKPDDAYLVDVGLGTTMTADDILNGIMRISVKVAVSHPAEFIVISFEQQMQKS